MTIEVVTSIRVYFLLGEEINNASLSSQDLVFLANDWSAKVPKTTANPPANKTQLNHDDANIGDNQQQHLDCSNVFVFISRSCSQETTCRKT